ncbi:flagellar basal body L-ring protein FlgH [Bradyrhizobium ontarionense]|uniref:Flagellar basal body L-ring protein FlgH n=1 Tax=Bradyrhizobium ontarionense TaxID=2898149 RepID=A0ABY3RP40_9BRAD|nr:flagellar basal body L-ring protein FlgH [Bradyrhizobium sp. A19]UFZ08426.1 flagellar basal body L-ring protein FlgH [Bradyrhizobium sp. A19]
MAPTLVHHPRRLVRSEAQGAVKPRAAEIGDIVTVVVSLADEARASDRTVQTESDGTTDRVAAKGEPSAAEQLRRGSPPSASGDKTTAPRRDAVRMSVAAVVTKVLLNGSLAVEGRRAMRIDGEIVDLAVAGVIRSDDICVDHTIDAVTMKQARISYRRRGTADGRQQPGDARN